MIKGVDISNNQGRVDWKAIAASGVKFAGLKASGGIRFKDRFYADNVKGCLDNAIYPFAYHFEHDSPGGSGRQEAENFLEVITKVGLDGHLPPCLDLEIPLGGAEHDWALEFQNTVRTALGKDTLTLYGSSGNLEPWLKNDVRFTQDLLWVAHYTSAPKPWVPKPWKDWTFWQYSSTGRVPGVDGNCDVNWFNGSAAELDSLVQGGSELTEPEWQRMEGLIKYYALRAAAVVATGQSNDAYKVPQDYKSDSIRKMISDARP